MFVPDTSILTDQPPCSFRTMVPEDEPFAIRLYGITLRHQMSLDAVGLTQEQIDALTEHQYRLMMIHYNSNYPWADISIVLREGEPVGRLIIIDFENEIRLGDLMILPEYQNNGICTYIMRMHVARGIAQGKKIRLHVEKVNRAVALYEREGFAIVEDLSSHWLMEYSGR
ncbi:MAG: GNAT family N-acetyltransferase [Bacteroidetes bacterium]|nr:GNAT family N-acetyltransferase [Bacteroidota bacterium]